MVNTIVISLSLAHIMVSELTQQVDNRKIMEIFLKRFFCSFTV